MKSIPGPHTRSKIRALVYSFQMLVPGGGGDFPTFSNCWYLRHTLVKFLPKILPGFFLRNPSAIIFKKALVSSDNPSSGVFRGPLLHYIYNKPYTVLSSVHMRVGKLVFNYLSIVVCGSFEAIHTESSFSIHCRNSQFENPSCAHSKDPSCKSSSLGLLTLLICYSELSILNFLTLWSFLRHAILLSNLFQVSFLKICLSFLPALFCCCPFRLTIT